MKTVLMFDPIEIPPADKSGRYHYVYFMQTARSGAVKIGHASNIKQRISSVRTGNHEKVFLFFWIRHPSERDAKQEEKFLHALFEKHKLRGEWFRSHEEIAEYIGSPERKDG